jgi:hypothetical protein
MSGNRKKHASCRGIKKATKNHLALVAIAILLAGCAPSYKEVMQRYNEAPVCCASFSEFSYEELRPGDSKSFDLNDKSPAFAFDTGKSYFKAFRLPLFSGPYRITIWSEAFVNDIDSPHIFLPQAILLNDEKEVVRIVEFHPRSLKFEADIVRHTLKLHIDMGEKNLKERYLVIYTTKRLLNVSLSASRLVVTPIIFPGFVTVLPIGKTGVLVQASPVGRITVSVGESPARGGTSPGEGRVLRPHRRVQREESGWKMHKARKRGQAGET